MSNMRGVGSGTVMRPTAAPIAGLLFHVMVLWSQLVSSTANTFATTLLEFVLDSAANTRSVALPTLGAAPRSNFRNDCRVVSADPSLTSSSGDVPKLVDAVAPPCTYASAFPPVAAVITSRGPVAPLSREPNVAY